MVAVMVDLMVDWWGFEKGKTMAVPKDAMKVAVKVAESEKTLAVKMAGASVERMVDESAERMVDVSAMKLVETKADESAMKLAETKAGEWVVVWAMTSVVRWVDG